MRYVVLLWSITFVIKELFHIKILNDVYNILKILKKIKHHQLKF